MRPVALLLAMFLLAPAIQGANIIVLPPANVSGEDAAADETRLLVAAKLEKRGWKVVPFADVDAILEAERIRYLDSLTAATRQQLITALAADATFSSTVLAWREDGRDPSVAIAARITDGEGRVIWGDIAAASMSQSEGVLGLRRPASLRALADDATTRLARNIPSPGSEGRVVSGAGGPLLRRAPPTFRSARHGRGDVRRVCILPFESTAREAARIVMEILTVRLASSGEFEVVEPADFRAAMQAERFQSVLYLTSEELVRLAPHIGTTLFLRGTVHSFVEAPAGRSEIQLDMNLADVATGEILWAVAHQRRGSDYAGLLERGTITSLIGLADRVLSETIAAQARAPLRGPTTPRSGSRLANRKVNP